MRGGALACRAWNLLLFTGPHIDHAVVQGEQEAVMRR